MFAKAKFKKIATLLMCGASISFANAQTIEEITDLNKQKVVAELRKQVDASKAEPAKDLLATNRNSLSVTKEATKDRLPDIVAIYGQRPDALVAILNDGGARNIRTRVGDFTSAGWEIEKITPSAITFRKELPAKKKSPAKNKNSDDDQRTFKRMSVNWSNSTPIPVSGVNSQGVTAQMPPMPMQSVPMMGYGASQPPALTVQLPQAAGVR